MAYAVPALAESAKIMLTATTAEAEIAEEIEEAEQPRPLIIVDNGHGVMLGDTVTLIGMMSLPIGLITDETVSNMKVSVDDYASASLKQLPRTTDFEISHVTEQPGS